MILYLLLKYKKIIIKMQKKEEENDGDIDNPNKLYHKTSNNYSKRKHF